MAKNMEDDMENCECIPGVVPRGPADLVNWVAVKELKLSYHNGYIQ